MTTHVAAKILIIDDDDLVRETIGNVLELSGHKIIFAVDGRSGIDEVIRSDPDLVICDVRMPRLNGYEVLKELRDNHPAARDIPFIFLSGLSDKQYIMAGYRIGADDFLIKPFDNDLLRAKVDAIIRQTQRSAPAPAEHHPEPGDKASEASMASSDFQTALSDMKGGQVSSGNVRLVSLEETKQAFGNRWESVREKALNVAEAVVRENARPGDTFTRDGDDGFIILFQNIDEDTAAKRVESLAFQIKKRLLAEGKQAYSDVAVAADAIDASEMIDKGTTAKDIGEKFDKRATEQEGMERDGPTAGNLAIFKAQLTLYFQPLWSPAKQSVIAYRCFPVRRTPYGVLSGPAVSHGGSENPWSVHLDLFIVESLKKILMDTKNHADPAIISVPIHFQSISGENADILRPVLKSIPNAVLKKSTILEIIGIPPVRSELWMGRATRFAFDHSGHASFELPPDDRHISILRASGIKFLQYEAPPSDPFEEDKAILRDILKRGEAIKKAGFSGRIHGLESVEQVQVACQAGYTLLAGKPIGSVEESPSQAYPLAESKILGR